MQEERKRDEQTQREAEERLRHEEEIALRVEENIRLLAEQVEAQKKEAEECALRAHALLNRSPTRALDGKTPFEAWHGTMPIVYYLRTFGCVAHVKITKPNQKKFDDRSIKTVFVGYEAGSKAYHCYDPVDRRVIITRGVVFDEAS